MRPIQKWKWFQRIYHFQRYSWDLTKPSTIKQSVSNFDKKTVFPGIATSIIKIGWLWDRQILIITTSSYRNTFRVTGPLCGDFTSHRELPSQRPLMRNFDVFFDLCLNKRLCKQSGCRWSETPPCSLWRICNDTGKTGIFKYECRIKILLYYAICINAYCIITVSDHKNN